MSMAVAARLACARVLPRPLVALGASAMLASAVATAAASRWTRRVAFSAFFFPLPLRTLPLTSFFSSSNFYRQHLAVRVRTHGLIPCMLLHDEPQRCSCMGAHQGSITLDIVRHGLASSRVEGSAAPCLLQSELLLGCLALGSALGCDVAPAPTCSCSHGLAADRCGGLGVGAEDSMHGNNAVSTQDSVVDGTSLH